MRLCDKLVFKIELMLLVFFFNKFTHFLCSSYEISKLRPHLAFSFFFTS